MDANTFRFCTACREQMSPEAAFCSRCGKRAEPSVYKRKRDFPVWMLIAATVCGGVILAAITMALDPNSTAPSHDSTAVSSPEPSSGNPFNDKLLAMSEHGRAYILAGVVGTKCAGTGAFYRGVNHADNSAFWSVRCGDGSSYQVEIKADIQGTTTYLDCSVLRALHENCFEKFPN